MGTTWTTEQILALAPDDSSAKAGKGLASARHWVSKGQKDSALWGECQGSGSKPYQVQIDLTEPAFKCSCPSRKFPCKHGIGLFLLYAEGPDAVPTVEPPTWVSEWLDKRREKTEKREAAAKPDSEKSPDELAKAAADQAKRTAAREKKVTQGLHDLDLWLRDIVRQGFGSLPSRPLKFWDDMAARMVDAQAPGVARMLREMGEIASSGDGWQERLLERFGLLYLLIEGYQRIESLPESLQSDVRDGIGFHVRQEELMAQPGIADLWYVAGHRVYEDLQFRIQRAYLIGQRTGKTAMILNFAPLAAAARGFAQLDAGLVAGAAFETELVYYPSAAPLRAVLKDRTVRATQPPLEAGYDGFGSLLSAFADSVSANPWREEFPALLRGVTPRQEEGAWYLSDSKGERLPLPKGFRGGWRLLALSGGYPLPAVFGEWNGERLLPLASVSQDGGITAFS